MVANYLLNGMILQVIPYTDIFRRKNQIDMPPTSMQGGPLLVINGVITPTNGLINEKLEL